MKSLLLRAVVIMAFLSPALALAASESYTFDANHTNIDWRASHFGFSSPSGKFAKSSGTLLLDTKSPAKSVVDITIDTTSLVTGIDKFNDHLMSKDFLDVAQYPTARFVSTKIKITGKNTADVTGDLTLHGVTKPVTLKTTLNKLGVNEFSKTKTAGFSATTILKRSDFGITMAIPGVSDAVTITIEAEANPTQGAQL